jgi:hypothetical protein
MFPVEPSMTSNNNLDTNSASKSPKPEVGKTQERVDNVKFDGTIAQLNEFEVVPTLNELSAGSVNLILKAIKEGESIQIPANTKIELEEAGLIESMTESAYNEFSQEVAKLPEVAEQLESKTETQINLQTKVDDLTIKLDSGWHRFWSSSRKLADEERQLRNAETDLAEAGKVQQDTADYLGQNSLRDSA